MAAMNSRFLCSGPSAVWVPIFFLCLQVLRVTVTETLVIRDPVAEALDYVEQIARQKKNCSFGPSLNLNYNKVRWTAEANVAVRAANLLSALFRTGDHMRGIHEADSDLLYSIVLSNVENNHNVFGSAIAFVKNHYRDYEIYCPYAFRAPQGITTKDLSIGYDYHTNGTDWFHIPRMLFQDSEFNWFEQITRLNNSELLVRYDSDLFLDIDDGYWTKPYFDCGGGDVWMVTFSMPFFWTDVTNIRTAEERKLSFIGVTTIDVSLDSLDIQQCDRNEGDQESDVFDPFVGSHRCKNTTRCLSIPNRGFKRGSYLCECKSGYYHPDGRSQVKAFDGSVVEAEYFKMLQGVENIYDSGFNCLPCAEGCDFCLDDRKCVLEIATILEMTILISQCFIICVLLVTGVYTFLNRNNRVIKAASPSLLYVLLVGAALLHSEIVFLIEWVHPVSCYIQSCLRHLGFSLVYGSLLLKTWRITKVFQVTSAKRVRIPDSTLLVRLVLMLVITGVYFAAAACIDFSDVKETSQVIEEGYIIKFQSCEDEWWNHGFLGVEMVLLVWGIYLCYRVRKAPSEFNEARYISFSIYNQAIVQIFVPILEIALYATIGSPNMIAFISFVRVHITATIMVALIFGSKIVFVQKEAGNSNTSRFHINRATDLTIDTVAEDFSLGNPAVLSEIERMEKYISSIARQLRDHQTLLYEDTNSGVVSNHTLCKQRPAMENNSTKRDDIFTITTAGSDSLDKETHMQ